MLVSWLLVAFAPGFLMLAVVGLERLETGLRGDDGDDGDDGDASAIPAAPQIRVGQRAG